MLLYKVEALLVTSFFAFINVSFSQDQSQKILPEGYYVVVAAYAPSKEAYAVRYMEKLNSEGHSSSYGFSHYKNLYFVYLHFDRDYRSGLAKMRSTRQNSEFHDAWVYVMGDFTPPVRPPVTELEVRPLTDVSKSQTANVNAEPKTDAELLKEEATKKLKEKVIYQESQLFENKAKEDLTLADFHVFFNLYNAANLSDVSGEIQIIDAQRSSLVDVLPGGSYHKLRDPNNRTGELLLIADIFGYRKMQRFINYYDPLRDSLNPDMSIIADIFVVDFNLVRYHVGDIATMFNVYFFKDAAMMLPESTYEVNQLLSMMKENPNYKIRIHGHTNGNSPGKIITAGQDRNLFALTDDDEEGYGSAKKLSEERALIIKEYLTSQGIAPDRMEIRAWGGRRMLYDKHSSQAALNVRVEIEILEE